jgi:hypothetical protein
VEEGKKKEEEEPPKEEKKLPIEQLNLVKEVLRVASQSYNLASNTVDLFNLIRGAPGIGGGGGDNGGKIDTFIITLSFFLQYKTGILRGRRRGR